MANQYDVVVVGGGIVGAVLAVALRQSGFATALVEARQPQPWDSEADYQLRVSAISPASRRLLVNLGLWEFVRRNRHCAYGGMRVWDAGGRATLEFEHTALGLSELGHIIENDLIIASAWQAMTGVQQYCPAKLADLALDARCATVTLDDGQRITANLVVGAEGAKSPVREAAGIKTVGWGYGQRCTVGSLTPEKSHQHICWQRYTPTGPVAFLPLEDGRCSLAWHADNALEAELKTLDDAQFCQRLTDASDGALGRIRSIDARASFPLRLQHAVDYVRPRVALAGDAAHVLHPMAGQGVNLGLMDVAALVDALEQGDRAGRDPGDVVVLRRYQRARKVDNIAMLAATDVFKRVFGNDNHFVGLLRDRCLSAAQTLAPVRQIMIRQAAGLGGRQPPLLREN